MEFTNAWFDSNIPLWEQYLLPLKDKELAVLEIGSFEGKSAVWLLENVLLHPESHITCVDAYKDYPEMERYHYDWEAIKQRFLKNTEKWGDKVTLHVEDSTQFLKHCDSLFDIIYIDGSHFAEQVLVDSVLSHVLLKKDGLIIFDDYLYGGLVEVPLVPKPAIDAFMRCFAQSYDPLSIGYQVILKKK